MTLVMNSRYNENNNHLFYQEYQQQQFDQQQQLNASAVVANGDQNWIEELSNTGYFMTTAVANFCDRSVTCK
jgi:hypothetical protein